jgi:hypothetical protein
MISVTGVTGKYILQPGLVTMHQESLNWLSTAEYWKRELAFFQKLLDSYVGNFTTVEPKKQIDHYQNLITYYKGELVDLLKKRIRDHEHKLARMLNEVNEADVEYIQEHNEVIEELTSFSKVYNEFKNSFFEFIELEMHLNRHRFILNTEFNLYLL